MKIHKRLAAIGLGLAITFGGSAAYADTLGVSTGNHVNIRQAPNTNCTVLGQVNKQDSLSLKGKLGDWYQINYNGSDAWIYGAYVSSSDLASVPVIEYDPFQSLPQFSGTREQILAYAKQFMGTPYRWGGTSLNYGVDCSGFTQSVMSHFGIYINRVSRDQVYNGVQVAKDSLLPGDLVFFDTKGYNNGAISHVGIYAGNGSFIQSSSYGGVIISSLSEGYYHRTYVTGVRIFQTQE